MIEEIIKNDVMKAEQIFSQSDNKIELIKNICEKGYRKEFLELLTEFCLGNKKTINNIFLNRTFNDTKERKKKTIITVISNIETSSSKKILKEALKY